MTGRSKGRQVLSDSNPASPWDASLKQSESEMAALLNRELERQQDNIELIASENLAPPAVLDAVGSVLTNKYAEGYPGCLLYTSPSPRDGLLSRMPSSA